MNQEKNCPVPQTVRAKSSLHEEFSLYAFHTEAVKELEGVKWSAKKTEERLYDMQYKSSRFMSLFPDYAGGGPYYQCRIIVDLELVRNMTGQMERVEKHLLYEFRHLVNTVFAGRTENLDRLK